VRRLPALVALVALGLGGLALVVARSQDNAPRYEVSRAGDAEHDYDFVIPQGTWERIMRKERVEILPARLEVRVGESIRIRNLDSHGVTAGIFYVGPQETVRMVFTSPGELSGMCQIHPDGKFTISVRE
jgi:hypothetical protein